MTRDVAAYLEGLPGPRRDRLTRLCKRFQAAAPGARLTMRYKMPTFELDDRRVSLGNQKQYLAVYFCCNDLIGNIIARHPEINTGVGCVRVRDTQDVPEKELLTSFRKALAQ
jgi:uncharacterized protein YdhG (YjbR/CyaY superfamily)